MKNILLTAGFTLVSANLGSVTAEAGQSDLSGRGEFFTVSAEYSCFTPFFPSPGEVCLDSELYGQSRKNLDKKATDTCSGRNFSIDESSVEQTMTPGGHDELRFKPGGGRTYTVTTVARVFCINGE